MKNNEKAMPRMLRMEVIEIEKLGKHPDAEAFGAEEEDRAALSGSVAECGLLDPLSVVVAEGAAAGETPALPGTDRAENGAAQRFWVIDGCGRLDALKAGGAKSAPCMVFDLGGFSVREFALHRNTMQRKVTTGQRVLCYLATVSRETVPHEKMASHLGCSKADIVAADALFEAANDKADAAAREVYEDVLAGRTPIRRWKAALAGRKATKDQTKRPIDYGRLAAAAMTSLATVFEAWPHLKGALKDEIEEMWASLMERVPFATDGGQAPRAPQESAR